MRSDRTDKPRDDSGAETRSRLIAGARKQFLMQGFRGVTMDDLASELGVSKKTIYQHFPSKRVLLEAVLDNKLREVQGDLEQITSRSWPQAIDALVSLVACVQRHAQEFGPPFVRDMHREAPDLFEILSKRRGELIGQSFDKVLRRGQRAGIIRKDIPIRVMVESLLGAMQSVVNPAKLAECGLTPQQGFSAVVKVVLEGVMSQKGRVKP